MKRLLIDAISTSSGGAINHLKIIVNQFHKQNYFDTVDVFLPENTKKKMTKIKNVNYICPKFFLSNLFLRVFWQVIILNIKIIKNKYNCIFVTGSSHFILSCPVVTISQNLLPFAPKEVKKYFFSYFYLKLKILYFTQKFAFKFSEGVIFLHHISRKIILDEIGKIKGDSKIVAHGLNLSRSFKKKKYKNKKYRLIYVSNIDYYKNQIFLLKSIDLFLEKNPNLKNLLTIEFYGGYYLPALKKFNYYLSKKVHNKKNFKYFGLKDSKFIYQDRKGVDTIFLFASSCENFSVSLIEGMSSGYPIICADQQPMKSVLGSGAIFYKHDSILSFQNKLNKIIFSKKIQNKLSRIIHLRSKRFNDNEMAKKTFKFLIKISKKNEK
jgi:glycosyltransferase involved in cell wall biosynthesis